MKRREGLCRDAQVYKYNAIHTYIIAKFFQNRKLLKSSLIPSLTFFATILLRNFSSVRLIVFAGGCAIIDTAKFNAANSKIFCLQHHDVDSEQENQICRKIAYVKISKKEKDNEKGERKKIEKMVRLRNTKNNYSAKREQE